MSDEQREWVDRNQRIMVRLYLDAGTGCITYVTAAMTRAHAQLLPEGRRRTMMLAVADKLDEAVALYLQMADNVNTPMRKDQGKFPT